jgi:hypothetical protein
VFVKERVDVINNDSQYGWRDNGNQFLLCIWMRADLHFAVVQRMSWRCELLTPLGK